NQVTESDGLPLKQQTKSIYLGNKQGQTRWFNGVLDEVKITVPTTNFPSPTDDENTLALWHMESINGSGDVPDDDFDNAGRDADLILSGPLLTSNEAAIPGKALVFDGVDDMADSTDNWMSENDTVRVEFWMNSNTDSLTSNQTIITATSTWQIHLVEDD